MTSFSLSQTLWTGETRKDLEGVFHALHGKKESASLLFEVSQQALLTYMKSLVSLLDYLYTDNAHSDAGEILNTVQAVFDLEDPKHPGLHFNDHWTEALALAAIHASLSLVLNARKSDMQRLYKETTGFFRRYFAFPRADYPRTCKQRDMAIRLIKRVIKYVSNDFKKEASNEAKKFVDGYPIAALGQDILSQSKSLKRQMSSMWVRDVYARLQKEKDDSAETSSLYGKQAVAGKRKREQPNLKTPDYFSEDDDDGEVIIIDEERDANRGFANTNTEGDVEPSWNSAMEVVNTDADDNPTPQRKKPRLSLQKTRNINLRQLPSRKSDRNRGTKSTGETAGGADLMAIVNDMDSQQFSESSRPPEEIHVARHAEQKQKRKRGRPRKARPKFVNDSAASDSGDAAEVVVEKLEDDDNSNCEDEIQEIGAGSGADTLKELKYATSKLDANGRDDPIHEVRKEISRAKRRSSVFVDPAYEPGDGRKETTFDSDDDGESEVRGSALRRKRKTNLHLSRSPISASKRVGKGGVLLMFGKICRTGRFEPYEVDKLLSGLQKYGWGAWNEISQSFDDGDFTRAPTALKDRARTMHLNPQNYPLRRRKGRGRPRGSGATRGSAASGDDIDEDEIEDEDEIPLELEGDPIEVTPEENLAGNADTDQAGNAEASENDEGL